MAVMVFWAIRLREWPALADSAEDRRLSRGDSARETGREVMNPTEVIVMCGWKKLVLG